MKTLVIAPHPDDELLGCGGTLLRRTTEGHEVGWVVMTAMTTAAGWSQERINQRLDEIDRVREGLHIFRENLYQLGFPAAELDQISMCKILARLSDAVKHFEPNEVLLPHPGDIHSDHRLTFEAASVCTKWFRFPSIKRVMTYETLSETEFDLNPLTKGFEPNLFVDIGPFINKKLSLLNIYSSELGQHPFPRSLAAVKSQAILRGAQMGAEAAEAFQVLKEFE